MAAKQTTSKKPAPKATANRKQHRWTDDQLAHLVTNASVPRKGPRRRLPQGVRDQDQRPQRHRDRGPQVRHPRTAKHQPSRTPGRRTHGKGRGPRPGPEGREGSPGGRRGHIAVRAFNYLNAARLALGEPGLEGTDLLDLVGLDAAAVVAGRSKDLHQTSITWLARTAHRLDVRAILTDSTEQFVVELGSTRIEVREGPSDPEGNEFCILRALPPEEPASG